MSLFAYTQDLAPNLFFFLQNMRISRFLFMPNIFKAIYVPPNSFSQSIPQKVVDTEGALSFAYNGTTFFFFLLFFIIITLIVYFLSSNANSNRPLRNMFIRVWETRFKFGIIHDFLWLFAVNILVQAFLQFRYTTNKGDLAFAIICLLVTLGAIGGLFWYAIKQYK